MILKLTVLPRLTLMSVAKPSMLESPAPTIPHSLSGLPGLWFSRTISLDASEKVVVAVWAPDGRGQLELCVRGATVHGDVPLRDDRAIGNAIEISGPAIRHAERRVHIGNTVHTRIARQIDDGEGDGGSRAHSFDDEGRHAARRIVSLVGRDGHRLP